VTDKHRQTQTDKHTIDDGVLPANTLIEDGRELRTVGNVCYRICCSVV